MGFSLGSSVDAISVSTKALRRMEFDRLKFSPMQLSKSEHSFSVEDDEEVYAVSDGQLLNHLVGEVSEVGLDDVALGSCIELQATDRKSRTSSLKRNAWPNKKPKISKSSMVSK